jgi:hypothetical protein
MKDRVIIGRKDMICVDRSRTGNESSIGMANNIKYTKRKQPKNTNTSIMAKPFGVLSVDVLPLSLLSRN